MNEVLEVLGHIKRAAAGVPKLPASWPAALAVAARIEAQLTGDLGDVRQVRALAAEGEALVAGRHVALTGTPPGEVPCMTALGLWFGALKWYGRGVFDQAMENILSEADAVLDGRRLALRG